MISAAFYYAGRTPIEFFGASGLGILYFFDGKIHATHGAEMSKSGQNRLERQFPDAHIEVIDEVFNTHWDASFDLTSQYA